MYENKCRHCGYVFRTGAELIDHLEYSIAHPWPNGDPLCMPQEGDDD